MRTNAKAVLLLVSTVLAAPRLTAQTMSPKIGPLIERGDIAKLLDLLRARPAIVSERDAQGNTPLHLAASLDVSRPAVVQALLSAGANPNARNTQAYQETPLWIASARGHLEVVRLLLLAGAEVNPRNSKGISALQIALAYGHKGVVWELLAHGPTLDIFEAAQLGRVATVANLVRFTPSLIGARNYEGLTALQVAAIQGQQEVVDLLISLGAPLDLFNAAASGRSDAVAACLRQNASSVAAVDSLGLTALDWAIAARKLDIAQMLIDHGADVNRPIAGTGGNTHLHTAALAGDLEVVEFLLRNHADAGVKNGHGRTPYDIAVSARHHEVAAVLKAN